MQTVAQRLASFQGEQQVAKRRTSNQRKKGQNTAAWPHQTPTPDDVRIPDIRSSIDLLTSRSSWPAQGSSTTQHLGVSTMSNALPATLNLMDGSLLTMQSPNILHTLQIAPGPSAYPLARVKNTTQMKSAWSKRERRHIATCGRTKERRTGSARPTNWLKQDGVMIHRQKQRME